MCEITSITGWVGVIPKRRLYITIEKTVCHNSHKRFNSQERFGLRTPSLVGFRAVPDLTSIVTCEFGNLRIH